MRKPVDLVVSYRLLNHGPTVLVSSLYNRKPDITPITWVMPISDEPPQIALCIWEGHFIYKCIMKTKDFVINIPDMQMVDIVLKCGKVSGRKVDKFKKHRLKQEPSKIIKSPRLAGCIGILECELVKDKRLTQKYNIIIGEVKYAEAEEGIFNKRWLFEKGRQRTLHHLGEGVFVVPSDKVLR